ncbi:hypothetical protein C7S14_0286 [Burkholderia cepacia]|nr:hypothetical protein C7S14_0286 [Burkholderia cepacia]
MTGGGGGARRPPPRLAPGPAICRPLSRAAVLPGHGYEHGKASW